MVFLFCEGRDALATFFLFRIQSFQLWFFLFARAETPSLRSFFFVSRASSSGFSFCEGRDALATAKQGPGHIRYFKGVRGILSASILPGTSVLFFFVSRASSSGFPFLRGQGRPRYVLFFFVSRASSSGFPFARAEMPSLQQTRAETPSLRSFLFRIQSFQLWFFLFCEGRDALATSNKGRDALATAKQRPGLLKLLFHSSDLSVH